MFRTNYIVNTVLLSTIQICSPTIVALMVTKIHIFSRLFVKLLEEF